MHFPFLTIGIASYNYGKYLDKAIMQIKRQSFKDIEVLYCDDGSTDGSVEKIKDMIKEEKDINIRLIEGEHLGILANRNRIIDNANGQYLMICDADDCMCDGCLEKLCQMAKQTQADCVIGGFCEVDDEGKILKMHIPTLKSSKWLFTWHHGQIYRLDIVRKYGIRFEQIPDDVFFLQNVHKYCSKVSFVPECVYEWYRHGKSASNNIIENHDWHPVKLWENIAANIGKMRKEADTDAANDLGYYLYKWYYFNISDLCKEKSGQIKECICIMGRQMELAIPGHLQWKLLKMIVKANDTGFARCAVSSCFILEKMHLLKCVVYARKLQNRLRE